MSEKILFKGIVGSQSFGTATVGSDVDYIEVFQCDKDDLLGFKYKETDDIHKDYRRHEIGKFIKLLMNGNPNALEILNLPEDCIIIETEEWKLLKDNKGKFITKNLYNTFANYAKTQITKAKGLNKKINWEGSKVERKDILDFSFFYSFEDKVTVATPIKKWLEKEGYKQESCGLVGIDHFRYSYLLYVDELVNLQNDNPRFKDIETFHFRGICKEGANDVHTSSVPKYCISKGILYCNLDG